MMNFCKPKVFFLLVLSVLTLCFLIYIKVLPSPFDKFYLNPFSVYDQKIDLQTKQTFEVILKESLQIPLSRTKYYDVIFHNKEPEEPQSIIITIVRDQESLFWQEYANDHFKKSSEFSRTVMRDKNDEYSLSENGGFYQLYPGDRVVVRNVPIDVPITFGTIPHCENCHDRLSDPDNFSDETYREIFEVYAKPSGFIYFIQIIGILLFWIVIINNIVSFFTKHPKIKNI